MADTRSKRIKNHSLTYHRREQLSTDIMQYETNQNTKLVIRYRRDVRIAVISLPLPEPDDIVLLEIENYVGFMHFDGLSNIKIDGKLWNVVDAPFVLEFIKNKPVLTIYVYHKN